MIDRSQFFSRKKMTCTKVAKFEIKRNKHLTIGMHTGPHKERYRALNTIISESLDYKTSPGA